MSIGPKTTLSVSRSTSSDDGMGGKAHVWATVKTIVGVFSILSDRERSMYGKKAEAASYKFMVDHIFGSDILTTDRFMLGSRIMEIVSKENPLNQNRFAIFLLTENVNG